MSQNSKSDSQTPIPEQISKIFEYKGVRTLSQGIVGGAIAFSLIFGLRAFRWGIYYGAGFSLGYWTNEIFDMKKMHQVFGDVVLRRGQLGLSTDVKIQKLKNQLDELSKH